MFIVIDGVVHGAIQTVSPATQCVRGGEHRWFDWSFYYAISGASEHIETRCCMGCMAEEFRHIPGEGLGA